ncbi:MAG TPA: MlaD family protein [Candidatus Angelobacter sp.]|nr:MlaD family protein [Candidatus Angelobacter sp.]
MDPEVEQRDWLSRALGKHPSLTIAALAIAGVVLALALARPSNHALELKSYFKDAQGLHPGAKVRLAGVEVGSVVSVRARPELRDHPAEVVMLLQTPYELRVPNDSVVSLEFAGVLGEVFAEINVQDASGPPLEAGGVLRTQAGESPTPQQWLECFSNVVAHRPCHLGKTEAANQKAPGAPTVK